MSEFMGHAARYHHFDSVSFCPLTLGEALPNNAH